MVGFKTLYKVKPDTDIFYLLFLYYVRFPFNYVFNHGVCVRT